MSDEKYPEDIPISSGEQVRYDKWQRRRDSAQHGSDAWRSADRMLKAFRSSCEHNRFGTSLEKFKVLVAERVAEVSRLPGAWNYDQATQTSNLNVRVEVTSNLAPQVRVMIGDSNCDRMYFKLSGSKILYKIPLRGTGLRYSPTMHSLIPDRLESIREAAFAGYTLSESEVVAMLNRRSAGRTAPSYPRPHTAYNHSVQSDSIHLALNPDALIGKTVTVQLSETTKARLDAAFSQVSQDITKTSHNNVAKREAEKMIKNAERGYGTPDDMEAAALRLATLAQEIRSFDELEPSGDEPVITWKHSFEPMNPVPFHGQPSAGKEYTYVAVKLGERWYVTGSHQAGKTFSWRDFLSLDWAKELTTGDFLLVTEWTQVGGN